VQFSSIFATSTFLWAGGAAALLITTLYLLKLRKRRIQVPFSPLWQRVVVEHRKQNDWWRRLRRLLSWLLQIALAAALLFAAADPHAEDEVVKGRHIVLLIDSSASMAATDVSGGADRLDLAKKKAREIIETMGPEDRVMLVDFNDRLRPLSPFVSESSILEQPLREISVAATGTSYEAAVDFAANSLRGKSDGELILISDGAGGDFDKLAETALADGRLEEGTTLRHLKVGESADNLALTAFNVRRYIANKLDFELFVQVRSYFERPVKAEIEIYADGELVDSKPIELEAMGTHQQFYPSQAVSGERLEARVRLRTADARDVFPLDDRAYALLPPVSKADVLLVTDGNLYVEGPLILNPNLNVTTVAPDAYDPSVETDVVIFDRVALAPPARGDILYIDPSGDQSPWEVRETVADPIVATVRKQHPLMRWITFTDLNIGQASRLKTTPSDTVVASSALGVPILVARDGDDRRMVALSFDVRASDLPLRVAFPVLLINVVDWFSGDGESLLETYQTGESWAVEVPDGLEEVRVTAPDGESFEAPVYDGRAVVFGEDAGFYRLQAEGFSRLIAGNLANPTESAIAPANLKAGDKEVVTTTDALVFDRSEIWIWVLLAIFAVLFVEWWTYNRRITV
jgi:hypothetical protein